MVLQIVVSGVVATVGGMLSLGVLLGFLLGLVGPEHTWSVIAGGMIIGGLPLLLGAVMFTMGVRSLNAAPTKI
jgi:hypothetical protein